MEQEKKYQRLYDHISHHYDRYLDEDELADIVYHAMRDKYANEHVGLHVKRIDHNEREKAFHDRWLYENKPCAGINYGNGILQDLFIDKDFAPLATEKWHLEITSRERMIVATVIQWLGSNVGMGFLEASLKKCGYKIVKDEYI